MESVRIHCNNNNCISQKRMSFSTKVAPLSIELKTVIGQCYNLDLVISLTAEMDIINCYLDLFDPL